jgi:hypothetical protein
METIIWQRMINVPGSVLFWLLYHGKAVLKPHDKGYENRDLLILGVERGGSDMLLEWSSRHTEEAPVIVSKDLGEESGRLCVGSKHGVINTILMLGAFWVMQSTHDGAQSSCNSSSNSSSRERTR